MSRLLNTRILVIDDEDAVRDSFREILTPQDLDVSSLARASTNLFDDTVVGGASRAGGFLFELWTASGGREGLGLVERAVHEDRCFAAIFVDMRMPEWDGLETVKRIRVVDERAEIIFVTAYSDYTIDEVVRRAGANVTYHCKPFSVEEIRQIATKAVYEWNKARSLEHLIETVGELRTHHWTPDRLLEHVLGRVAELLGVRSAMLTVKGKENRYRRVAGTGLLANDFAAREFLDTMPGLRNGEFFQTDRFARFRLEGYDVLAVFDRPGPFLTNEQVYLARLFLEQAAQAIRNASLEEALLRSEKLSAVGRAVSMIAHDLRTHIGAMWSCLEMAEDFHENHDLVQRMLRAARRAGEDSLAMVEDLLDFSRNSEVVRSPVAIEELFDSVRHKANPFLEKWNIPLRMDTQSPFVFHADRRKIDRAVLNLVKNSAEALKRHAVREPSIEIQAEGTPHGCCIRVSDNGPGIPEELRERLFVPFSSFGNAEGTGLGLAIVKQFVESHGGTVAVDTSPKGTTFTIEIPGQ